MAGRFVGAILTAGVAAVCWGAVQDPPALPYESWGACPFECCTYRTWTVKTDTNILTERQDGAPTHFVVGRGMRVEGVTGVVVTTRFGLAVAERERTIGLKRIRVRPGDKLLLLHYLGEGIWKFWLRGEFDEDFLPDPANCRRSAASSATMHEQCAVQVLATPATTWWVKVRNGRGDEGWTRQVEHFGNKDACGNPPSPHVANASRVRPRRWPTRTRGEAECETPAAAVERDR